MKNIVSTLMILSVILLLISCTKDDDPVSGEQKNWFVVDTLGNPIEGAKIVASYYREVFDSTGVIATLNPDRKDSVFQVSFANVSDGHVDFFVKNYFTGDTIIVLLDSNMVAGYHSVIWDRKNSNGKYVLNDVYDFNYSLNGQSMITRVMVADDYTDVFESEIDYLTGTGNDGGFQFDASDLIREYALWYNDTDSMRFAHYIKLWAVKDGYENAYIDSLDLMGMYENVEIILK